MVRERLVLGLVGALLAGALVFFGYVLVVMLGASLFYVMALDGAIAGVAGVGIYALKSAWDTAEFNVMLQLYLEKLRFSEDARDRLTLRRAEATAEGVLFRDFGRKVIIIGDTVIIKHGGGEEE
jgi:cell division protein FtsX